MSDDINGAEMLRRLAAFEDAFRRAGAERPSVFAGDPGRMPWDWSRGGRVRTPELEAAQPNPYARENLTVASDRAQAAGDPLGTWLALGLERWMVGQREGLGELADWLEQRTAERGEQKVSRGQ